VLGKIFLLDLGPFTNKLGGVTLCGTQNYQKTNIIITHQIVETLSIGQIPRNFEIVIFSNGKSLRLSALKYYIG